MRTLFGMILGCVLTIGVLYVHDSMVVPGGAGTATPNTSRVIVNWNVATSEWGQITEGVHALWLKVTASVHG